MSERRRFEARELAVQVVARALDKPSVYMGGPSRRSLSQAEQVVRALEVADLLPRGERITHGRHCTCGACAAEDWTNPQLAPCGMHGSSCPRTYQPLGRPGDPVG